MTNEIDIKSKKYTDLIEQYWPNAHEDDWPIVCAWLNEFTRDSQKERAKEYIDQFNNLIIPQKPEWEKDRGIVICAGGWRFFACLYVSIYMIRLSECSLPIQVWYLDDNEYDPLMVDLLEEYDVEWVNATEFMEEHPEWQMKSFGGWQCKVLAAAACPFREVVSFDADCYPLINPEEILNGKSFQENGAIFWEDLPKNILTEKDWSAMGMEYIKEMAWESGQFVVNKDRHWDSIWTAWWMNSESDYVYSVLYGDKDTFHLAWRHRQSDVKMAKTFYYGVGFCCSSPDDDVVYCIHRCNNKLTLPITGLKSMFCSKQKYNHSKFLSYLPGESDAHEALKEAQWKLELASVDGRYPDIKSPAMNRMISYGITALAGSGSGGYYYGGYDPPPDDASCDSTRCGTSIECTGTGSETGLTYSVTMDSTNDSGWQARCWFNTVEVGIQIGGSKVVV